MTMVAAASAWTGCVGAGEVSDVGPVTGSGPAVLALLDFNPEGATIALPAGLKGQRELVAIGLAQEWAFTQVERAKV